MFTVGNFVVTTDTFIQGGIYFLSAVLVLAAIFAVWKKDLLISVIATSLISLVLSVLFYILHAPDVALTEAAIGVALSTAIFLITLRKTSRYEE